MYYYRLAVAAAVLSCLLRPVYSFAQNDSLTVLRAKWHKTRIAPGIKLHQSAFAGSLFNASQNINVLEVRVNRRNFLDVSFENRLLKQTSAFGRGSAALAAINGNFFDMKDGGSVDYLRSDGVVQHENRLEKGGRRALHQKAAIAIYADKVELLAWDGTENWEEKISAPDVMLSGPMLVFDGVAIKHDSTETYLTRHPRSSIGVTGKRVYLVTVDGRNTRAAGMNLFELGKLMKWLGCRRAINLDGGGSTTLWIKGEPENGVVNYPSDNPSAKRSDAYRPGVDPDNLPADMEKRDRSGERPVANVILVKRKK